VEADGSIHSEVIHIDRFGNLVTGVRLDLHDHWLLNLADGGEEVRVGPGARVEALGRQIGSVASSYSQTAPGSLVALVGSSGYLEISVRDGSAAEQLAGYVGASVRILRGDSVRS
jgi:S-adenosylmethionine hydrolase